MYKGLCLILFMSHGKVSCLRDSVLFFVSYGKVSILRESIFVCLMERCGVEETCLPVPKPPEATRRHSFPALCD